jgi:hypothetical protein
MMAQVLGISETCRRALEIREPSHIGTSTKSFSTRSHLRVVGHVTAAEPS